MGAIARVVITKIFIYIDLYSPTRGSEESTIHTHIEIQRNATNKKKGKKNKKCRIKSGSEKRKKHYQ